MSTKQIANKTGRPVKHLDPDRVRELASEGLTHAQLAVSLGICIETFRRRRMEDEAVQKAYAEGEAIALAKVEQTMFRLALDGDSAACRFILSTRRRDTYTTRQELSNPAGQEFQIAARPLTPKDRKTAIKEIRHAIESDY